MIEFAVWLIANFMSAIGIVWFYVNLFHNKNKLNLSSFLVFILGVIFSTFIKYFGYDFLSILSYFIFYPILFHVISKSKFKEVLYYSIIIWIYGALFDFLSMLIISFGNFFFSFNIYSSWFKIIPTMINMIFFILSSYLTILKKFTNKIVILLCQINHSDVLLITFFLFTLVGGVSIAVNIKSLNFSILLYLLVALVIVVFLLIIHCKNIDYEFNILVKNLQTNNNFYTIINDEYNMFKHNLMAKLLSVKSVSNKKARILIDELIKDFNSNIDYESNILDLPYGLDGVINQKLNGYNDKLEIKVSNNLEHDIFDVITPKRYNVLVEKLSLFIDNAIEASLASVEKILIINLVEENDSIKIEIKNTFAEKIDLDEIGKIHYSTKGKKRGFGLYSILRNNEVSVNVKVINEYFVGELMAKFM